MTSESGSSLFERRLVIVSGKGGTGKTSVAAALALGAARAGRRVLVAEVGPDEHLPGLLEPGAAPVGYAGRELLPGLTSMRVDPYDALGEYLALQLGAGPLIRMVLRNRGFRQLMDASPGWRELITLGKVWHLGEQRDASGQPLYDLIVVDAPATGHGITLLDVPRVVVSAVRAGPLRRHTSRVEAMLRDPDHTLLLPVALAEELPARETAEFVARVRQEIGIPVDRVVVNAVMPAPYPPGLENLEAKLARLPDTCLEGVLPRPSVLAASVAHLRARHELNRRYVEEIGASTELPVIELPYLMTGTQGREPLQQLGEALVAPPRVVAA
ncbi:MAG: chromosome partitioning protein [Deltaproteobacteria bacterium]|nr:MAG: chromosome partitioning protein [Deltaproteobacteria bacterium]